MIHMRLDHRRAKLELPQQVHHQAVTKALGEGWESREEFRPTEDDEIYELVRVETDIGDETLFVEEGDGAGLKVDRGDEAGGGEGEHFEGREDRVDVAFLVVEEVGELDRPTWHSQQPISHQSSLPEKIHR